jgi:hypothetical protein
MPITTTNGTTFSSLSNTLVASLKPPDVVVVAASYAVHQ